MGIELVEWTMGRHVLRLLAYLRAAEQVRGLEPAEQDLLRATEAALPLYRTPAEVSSFQPQLAAVFQAYTAAGARMAEAVAHEHAAADLFGLRGPRAPTRPGAADPTRPGRG